MSKRRSKARDEKVACKDCWDQMRVKYETSKDNLKSHIKTMNRPRTKNDKKPKCPHRVLTIIPSRYAKFRDFYPLENGNVIDSREKAQFRHNKGIQSMFNLHSNKLQKPKEPIRPPSHRKASNLMGNKSSNQDAVKSDISDNAQNQNNPIKDGFIKAINVSKSKFITPSISETQSLISAMSNTHIFDTTNLSQMTDSAKNEQLIKQNEIISDLQTVLTLQNSNALTMIELQNKESINGLTQCIIDDLVYLICAFCKTFVGTEVSGDWRTGILIKHNLKTLHRDHSDLFIQIKDRWRKHKKTPLHEGNYQNAMRCTHNGEKGKRELDILQNLFRIVYRMNIHRIANHNYSKMVAEAHCDGVDVGNQPHSRNCVNEMIETMTDQVIISCICLIS